MHATRHITQQCDHAKSLAGCRLDALQGPPSEVYVEAHVRNVMICGVSCFPVGATCETFVFVFVAFFLFLRLFEAAPLGEEAGPSVDRGHGDNGDLPRKPAGIGRTLL